MSAVAEEMRQYVEDNVGQAVACKTCIHATWFFLSDLDPRAPDITKPSPRLTAFCKAFGQSPYDSRLKRTITLCGAHQPMTAEPQQ